MTFRDSMFVYISACPDDQIAVVLRILADQNMTTEEPVADGELAMSPSSYADHASTGCDQILAAELIAAAPGISFEVWSHPDCQFGGSVVRHTPELGTWTSACDTEGEAVFSAHSVLDMVGLDGAAIRRRAGEDHREALNALDNARA